MYNFYHFKARLEWPLEELHFFCTSVFCFFIIFIIFPEFAELKWLRTFQLDAFQLLLMLEIFPQRSLPLEQLVE